jgi:small conductance mechanosensitive channel
MNLEDIEQTLTGSDVTGDEVLIALVLLLAAVAAYIFVGRFLRRVIRLPGQSAEVVDVVVRLIQIFTGLIFVGWALSVLGADAGWLAFVALGALVIGILAAKPVLEGLGASVALTRSAVSLGQEIAADDIVGEVVEITNRTVVFRTRDGRRVHIPNVEMLLKTITVYTVDDERRSAVDFEVAMDTDLDKVDRVVRASLDRVDAIRRVGAIRALSFGEGVKLSVRFWHGSSMADGADATDGAVRALKVGLDEAGIAFAPALSVDVTSHQSGPLATADGP